LGSDSVVDLSQLLARTLVFFTSASVLVIEILAGRLLAPYLGVSLEVFTGIIGVILAGISLGAWLGGRAADRMDPTRLPGPLMITGGMTAIASPPIIDFFGPNLGTDPFSIIFLATVGFVVPAALLTAVTPVIVKIRLSSLTETGSVVGGFSAIGTAGAIAGTFLTGFFLIAAFPTRPIVAGLGAVLVLWGALLMMTRNRWQALVAIAVAVGAAWILANAAGPCQFETTYHCAEVRVDTQRPSGRLLVLDRGHNSYVDLEDPTYLDFRYARVMADVIDTTFSPGPLEVLSVGGGGFTFPKYLDAVRPGTEHVVLEIDGELLTIGRNELGFTDEAEVVIADARQSISDVLPNSVDLVIGDAFTGLTVPWHLTTREFVSIVDSRMKPGGIYLINVIDYGDIDFARATARTFLEVFDSVAVFAPPSYLAGNSGGNFVVAGSASAIDVNAVVARIRSNGGVEDGISGEDLSAFIGDAPILHDDYAPVDQMIDRS
jgi:spermidine synthase